MRKILLYFFFIKSSYLLACGGGYWGEGMEFYSLFNQTNISAKEYYPFLRDEYNKFYDSDDEASNPHEGNVQLWNELLKAWSTEEIHDAIYREGVIDWSLKQTDVEQAAKTYIKFAKKCSKTFRYRARYDSWDYGEILNESQVDADALLEEANTLLSRESHPQLIARYYYQIIRILHYTERWKEAIPFFESKIENQLAKNEIYYYILDQIAGCYYSAMDYDKAAYLFTKVVNNSLDKKTSAFLSFNFCSNQGADGQSYFKGIEDEKDLLLIKSLTDFSDELSNINKFIALDANDSRIELLFMRTLNQIESRVWPANLGVKKGRLPYRVEGTYLAQLKSITAKQIENKNLSNTEFWKLINSYLSFISGDIVLAQNQLKEVRTFEEQKKKLSFIYKVFSWKKISVENEQLILQTFTRKGLQYDRWQSGIDYQFRNLILDKIAHTYYKNGEIAKAFLVHNNMDYATHLNSLELLNDLEKFYHKSDKSRYEEILIEDATINSNLLDCINYQKGIYYLYKSDPKNALNSFKKANDYRGEMTIPNKIFSNNILECFNCEAEKVMVDEVYKADVFSFIKESFNRKELANYLLELQELCLSETPWKAKLANYLLGNYYYNISNLGYYRGLLTDNTNIGQYIYLDPYRNEPYAEKIIAEKSGYNLSDIQYHSQYYYALSHTSTNYYQKVMELSTDKELNARCLYLIAKNELSNYYNEGSEQTYDMQIDKYYNLKLPVQKSFEQLYKEYSDTKFHEMIIKECGYYRYYTSHF